jgi:hypothetical protein
MKALALTIWIILILIDVIRNIRIIEVDRHVPDYGKTLILRFWVGFVFNAVFLIIDGIHGAWWQIGIMQVLIYAFTFDLFMNFGRARSFHYMGSASLPEKIFRGKHLVYLFLKFWLFAVGVTVLYYFENLASGYQ